MLSKCNSAIVIHNYMYIITVLRVLDVVISVRIQGSLYVHECVRLRACVHEGMRSESSVCILCVCVYDSGECVSRLASCLSVHHTSFLKIDNVAGMHTMDRTSVCVCLHASMCACVVYCTLCVCALAWCLFNTLPDHH